MPKPRKMLVSVDATPYYHCVSRCVRRAFLCGTDHTTGESYEHRREWIQDRIFKLVSAFAIDVAAYAVMSNHVHTVLHINTEQASSWTDHEVVERWLTLFSGPLLAHRFLKNELSEPQLLMFQPTIDKYRERLQDISWFMRCLNEDIARKANAEDQCTGRFWEGRFKSQALLDDKALLSCMAYVDLNPIRAKVAPSPETSDFTSIQERIHCIQNESDQAQPARLMPFIGDERRNQAEGLAFKLSDYLELLDWTGRVIREDKRGAISENWPSILDRLKITTKQWQKLSQQFEANFNNFAGNPETLKATCTYLGYQRSPGMSNCRQLLN